MKTKEFKPRHIANLDNFNIQKFIDVNTISERETLKKALCMPKSLPDSCNLKTLVPVGCAEFVGDKMPEPWSLNNDFDKGKVYPIYSNEGDFPIGKDGVGKKFHENNWRNIIFF